MKLTKDQRHVVNAFFSVIMLVLIGAVFYHSQESLNWTNSFYLTIMTVMTIGVNGFSPSSEVSKIFTMLYVLISVPTLLFCLSVIVEDRFDARIKRIEEHKERQKNSDRE